MSRRQAPNFTRRQATGQSPEH